VVKSIGPLHIERSDARDQSRMAVYEQVYFNFRFSDLEIVPKVRSPPINLTTSRQHCCTQIVLLGVTLSLISYTTCFAHLFNSGWFPFTPSTLTTYLFSNKSQIPGQSHLTNGVSLQLLVHPLKIITLSSRPIYLSD
jgi:hypothetical protein